LIINFVYRLRIAFSGRICESRAHTEIQVALFHAEHQRLEMHQAWNILRDYEFAKTWRTSRLDPRQDEVKGPVEEVHDVLVCSLLVADTEHGFAVLQPCALHADLLPLDVEIEVILQDHIELHLDVVIMDFEKLLGEILCVDVNSKVIGDVHLILGEYKSWSTTVEETGTERDIEADDVSETWHGCLQCCGSEVQWELVGSEDPVWNIDLNHISAQYDLEHVIDERGADL